MRTLRSRPSRFLPHAVEGTGTPAAKGLAAGVGQPEPDPDWQPL